MNQPSRTLIYYLILSFVLLPLILSLWSCGGSYSYGGDQGYSDDYAGEPDYYYNEAEVIASRSEMAYDEAPSARASYQMGPEPPAPAPVPEEPSTGNSTGIVENSESTPESAERLIIYSANVFMEVLSIEETKTKIVDHTETLGGFIQSSTSQGIIIRVPAEQFFDTLTKLAEWGYITRKDIFSQDVTDQFVDLAVRLENARKVKYQLEEMLKLAKTVEEALLIQKEIARLNETIQEMEDQLKYMTELIRYSTITIQFQETHAVSANALQNPFDWVNSIGIGSVIDAN